MIYLKNHFYYFFVDFTSGILIPLISSFPCFCPLSLQPPHNTFLEVKTDKKNHTQPNKETTPPKKLYPTKQRNNPSQYWALPGLLLNVLIFPCHRDTDYSYGFVISFPSYAPTIHRRGRCWDGQPHSPGSSFDPPYCRQISHYQSLILLHVSVKMTKVMN